MEEDKNDILENADVTKNEKGTTKRKKTIIVIVIIVAIVIMGLLMGYIIYSNNDSNKKSNVKELKDEVNKPEEEIIKMDEDTIKKLSNIYISNLDPMENSCINTKIDKKCLSTDDIANVVFVTLDEEQKFENEEELNEAEWNDYVSYDVYKQYVKNMFDIEDYKIPEKFNTKYQYCHKYTNTGKNIKRYTSGPGCSFGAHANTKLDEWVYEYENYVEEKNNITVTVIARYEYNEDVNSGNETTYYTDESKTTSVKDHSDAKLKRLKYNFKKGENYLTLLSIENQ